MVYKLEVKPMPTELFNHEYGQIKQKVQHTAGLEPEKRQSSSNSKRDKLEKGTKDPQSVLGTLFLLVHGIIWRWCPLSPDPGLC